MGYTFGQYALEECNCYGRDSSICDIGEEWAIYCKGVTQVFTQAVCDCVKAGNAVPVATDETQIKIPWYQSESTNERLWSMTKSVSHS
jgi:hypothetical protein